MLCAVYLTVGFAFAKEYFSRHYCRYCGPSDEQLCTFLATTRRDTSCLEPTKLLRAATTCNKLELARVALT